MKRAILVAALAACSSSSDASNGTKATAVFEPCFVQYDCATIDVPVDYAQPDGKKIGIRILRAPAKDPESRLGTVVVNPGGPGIAFVDRLASQYPIFSALFSEATNRFDVVTFDWRGVGRSAPITCVDDATLDAMRALDLGVRTPDATASVDAMRKRIVDGCASADQDLLARVDTETAARDLDRVRAALGEEKLDYLGISYGTWLGATYATLFPTRVRAFALDSATTLEADLEGDITAQAKSYDLGLDRFFTACASNPSCKLSGDVGARYDAILAKLDTAPIAAGARSLSSTDARLGIVSALRSADYIPLAADLASAEAGDGAALLARADGVTGRDGTGHYDSSIVGLVAIACLDQPLARSPNVEAFRAFADDLRQKNPRGGTMATLPWVLCAGWPYRRATHTPVSASKAPPMIVVAGRFDPITGYENGDQLVRLLGNGSSLVTYEGDGHGHALHSACVRDVITAFLIDPTKPPTRASCPAE